MEELTANWERQLLVLLDVLIAIVLGSAIGQEREKSEKPAGLRTNMIVAGISCFFVSITVNINRFLAQSTNSNSIDIDTDPIRVLQAILIGISFIGAGTVLKSKDNENIKYLTTAATLLFSSGIGVAVALKAYIMAVGLAIFSLLINLFNKIISRLSQKNK